MNLWQLLTSVSKDLNEQMNG